MFQRNRLIVVAMLVAIRVLHDAPLMAQEPFLPQQVTEVTVEELLSVFGSMLELPPLPSRAGLSAAGVPFQQIRLLGERVKRVFDRLKGAVTWQSISVNPDSPVMVLRMDEKTARLDVLDLKIAVELKVQNWSGEVERRVLPIIWRFRFEEGAHDGIGSFHPPATWTSIPPKYTASRDPNRIDILLPIPILHTTHAISAKWEVTPLPRNRYHVKIVPDRGNHADVAWMQVFVPTWILHPNADSG